MERENWPVTQARLVWPQSKPAASVQFSLPTRCAVSARLHLPPKPLLQLQLHPHAIAPAMQVGVHGGIDEESKLPCTAGSE
jgi:uncharacterized protein (DUF2062 family)